MAIDYEQIRKDNIEEYGKGTRHLAFFERLYSDGTHFVFELLQNAEDAKAKRIEFTLFDDRLEVRHDGRPFDEKDVRGVCGVGESTKEDDFTQIGRFGIGFKSVYAFTSNPVIHCGEEHFEIRNYVRPYAVEAQAIDKPWTTLIVIPFDKEDIDSEFAKSEIGTRLRGLSARTLLFLASVDKIEYRVAKGATGMYLRSSQLCVESSLISVVGESSDSTEPEKEQWLVFQKEILGKTGDPIVGPNKSRVPPIQIAFRLEEQESKKKTAKRGAKRLSRSVAKAKPWANKRIEALSKSPLVVFFPTEKDSQLGFLVQGPYRTTPARDNIPTNDDWNVSLIKDSATLLVGSVLPSLKEMELLTLSCFEALPINMEDFPEDDFFFPIADAVRKILMSAELLPAADGSFTSGESSVLGRGEDLRGLLGSEQLKQLFELEHDVKWLSGEITADRAPTFRDYLRHELDVLEVTPESFAANVSAEFMEKQSDEWVTTLYGCLLGWEALWKPRRESWNRTFPGSLRDRPFLRLNDDRHVIPFAEDGHPNAYLPLKGKSQVPVVKRSIASNKTAREFLKRLGLSEPDVVAEVIEELLPLYLSVDSMPSASDHADHMKQILSAWSTDSITKKERLEEKLKETPFVRYYCRATGLRGYAVPTDIYFPNDDLVRYFEGYEDAKFIVTSYSKDVRELLGELGVDESPRCFQVDYGDPPYKFRTTSGERIKNFVLDGLDGFLVRISDEEDPDVRRQLSLTLWNYVLAYADSSDNCFQATRHYFYYSSRYQAYDSMLVTKLRAAEWLPTSDGRFLKPPQVSIDQLPAEFEQNQKLIAALEIQPDPSEEAEQERQAKRLLAKQLGIKLEDAEFIRKNRDEFEQLRQTMANRLAHQDVIDASSSRDRERRRQKLQERREQAPTKVSVKKLRSVPSNSRSEIDRQSLFAFYHDDEEEVVFCQICLDPMPFVKRNGEDCGECVHLLNKKWADVKGYDLKVMTSLHLVLCPVCSEIYRDYVHKDVEKQAALFEFLTNGGEGKFVVCERDVRRDQKDHILHFNQTHLGDIRDCLDNYDGDESDSD